jgi:FkbM family methyltransferase
MAALDPADEAMFEAFRRAASYPSSSRIRKLVRKPIRSVAVKAGHFVGSATGWSIPVRTKTFWGAEIQVRIPEAVSNQLYCCGLFEPSMTSFMLHVLKRGDTFIDVGAHYGYFTLLASRLVGQEGRADAFEPTPSTCDVLRRNVGSLPNVHVNQAALWSGRTELEMTDLGTRLAAYNSVFPPRLGEVTPTARQVKQVRVQAFSLDDYCSSQDVHPHFVKIDAESAEYRILEGMEYLLMKDRPFVSLEVGDFGISGVPSSNALVQALTERDYMPFEYVDASIMPHTVRVSYQYDNILFSPSEHPFVRQLSIS